MSKKPYAYAILEGVAQEMRANPKLCVNFGQGDYTATSLTGDILNLNKEFPFPRTLPRHMNPIDEEWYAGWANGMAAAGFSALARFPNMAGLIATEYVYNNIAKAHYMTGGQIAQSVVLWMDGSNRRLGQAGQHTETGQESIYAFMAGLKIVCPSTVYDAKGLMKSAIRDDNPVFFIEHATLYQVKGEVPDDEDFLVPIGVSDVKRQGKDVTIVSYSKMLQVALEAAEKLAQAAHVLATEPISLQLRYLQTMVEMAGERTSTIIPMPLEIARTVQDALSARAALSGA